MTAARDPLRGEPAGWPRQRSSRVRQPLLRPVRALAVGAGAGVKESEKNSASGRPQRREIAVRGFHHERIAARINLVAGQIRKILHHRAVNEAGAPLPGVLGPRSDSTGT